MTERYALIVGIDEYKTAPLEFCVNDAREIATILQMDQYGFETRELLDSKATRRSIMQETEAIRLEKPEIFLFYFAGHGCTTELGTYLVTHDGEPLDEGISLDVLAKILALFAEEGTNAIAILDCCHSGACPWGTRPFERDDVEQAIQGLVSSRAVIAACRPKELTYEDSSKQHGLFTYHLIAGMLGGAGDQDGSITVLSLYEYVCRPFEEATGQMPVIRSDVAGRFILGSGFEPRLRKPLEEDLARQLESQARQYLDDYAQKTSVGFELWRREGYLAACQALAPVIRWFEGRIRDNPDLKNRSTFMELWDSTRVRLANLGNVDTGTRVIVGTKTGVLEARLGEGSFGSVWKVISDEDQGPLFAYKIYHPHELGSEEKIRRFERGYRAMRQLDHPQIVKVRDLTTAPLGFFMQFINGPNLRDLSPGGEDPVSTLSLLLNVAETILHAHGRTVIHRDIKPENIIVEFDETTESWVPHLTDFDLAWFSTATKFTKSAFGTMHYAAPEQLAKPQSKAAHQKTVDVFAFGQLCYFAVTRSDPIPLGVADNKTALEKRTSDWGSGKAAELFFELYSNCSEYRPEDRLSEFSDIVDALASIVHHLRTADQNEVLSPARLISEIVFSLVGLQTDTGVGNRSEFKSRSGRTSLALRVKDLKDAGGLNVATLEAEIRPTVRLAIVGKTQEQARVLLNSRIDAAIRPYYQVRRRSGRTGSYEVFLDISDVPLNMGAVEACRPALSRVIEVIEQS